MFGGSRLDQHLHMKAALTNLVAQHPATKMLKLRLEEFSTTFTCLPQFSSPEEQAEKLGMGRITDKDQEEWHTELVIGKFMRKQ